MLHHFLDLINKRTHFVFIFFQSLALICILGSHKTTLQAGTFTDDINCLLHLMMARKIVRLKDGDEASVLDNAHKRTCKCASAPRRLPLAPAWHLATQAVTWSNMTCQHCGAVTEGEPVCGPLLFHFLSLHLYKFLQSCYFTHRFYAQIFFSHASVNTAVMKRLELLL